MTIIEFYDKAAIENIAGAMLCKAQRMILIGDKLDKMYKSRAAYNKILTKRGIYTEITCKCIDKTNLNSIVDVFTEIALKYDDCIFDLTGGDELYLVAVGIIMEKFPNRVQTQRFNLLYNMLYDCDGDGLICQTSPYNITIEENILMYGGRIVTNPKELLHTYKWDFNDEFVRDVEYMWQICNANSAYWNAQVILFGSLFSQYGSEDSLKIWVDKNVISEAATKKEKNRAWNNRIVYDLKRSGLINCYPINDKIYIEVKNSQIKKCLTVAGQVLELMIACKMRSLRDNKGLPVYHDVAVGVVVDWDSDEFATRHHTFNEIDVFAMKDAIPIFISCKNGNFDANELYKINTVADRFGDKYAKKALVATKLDRFGLKGEFLRTRMNDMQIKCIDISANTTDSDLNYTLNSLWMN